MVDKIKEVITHIDAYAGGPKAAIEAEIDALQLSDLQKHFGWAYRESAKIDYQKEGAIKVWNDLGTKASKSPNLGRTELYQDLAEKIDELTLSKGALSFASSSKRKARMEKAHEAAIEGAEGRKGMFAFEAVFGQMTSCPSFNLLTGVAEPNIDGFASVRTAPTLAALEPFEEALKKAKEGLRSLENKESHTPRLARERKKQLLSAEQDILRSKLHLERPEAIGFGAKVALGAPAGGFRFNLDTKTYEEVENLEKALKPFEEILQEAKKSANCLSAPQITALDAELQLAKDAINVRKNQIEVICAKLDEDFDRYFNESATKAKRTALIRDELIEKIRVLPLGYFADKPVGIALTDADIKTSNELKAVFEKEIRDLCDKDDRAFVTRSSAPVLPGKGKVPKYEEIVKNAKPGMMRGPEKTVGVLAGIATLGACAYSIGAVSALTVGSGILSCGASLTAGVFAAVTVNYLRDGAITNHLPWSK